VRRGRGKERVLGEGDTCAHIRVKENSAKDWHSRSSFNAKEVHGIFVCPYFREEMGVTSNAGVRIKLWF
jgi:hypothetical protein